jgi:hypothetical protein
MSYRVIHSSEPGQRQYIDEKREWIECAVAPALKNRSRQARDQRKSEDFMNQRLSTLTAAGMRSALAVLLAMFGNSVVLPAQSQQPTASIGVAASSVPRFVRFTGSLKDGSGHALTGVVGVTFALYREQQGGAPLWLETQNAQLDSAGHYTVQLGAAKPGGLPVDLFTSGEAQWLGVQVSGQPEQPRVLLLSVPYALKAADAETIGGLPPSAFVLAAPQLSGSGSSAINSAVPAAGGTATTPAGTGTTNFIPLWTDSTGDLGNSVVFQSGSGATAKVGINTTTPASALDVKGSETVRGTLTLQTTGPSTASGGKNSQPLDFVASAFNSSTSTAVNQKFQRQAEPAANNTASPSGTLNLLYGLGATAASETGLKIGSKGLITFAAGQTFPGTGTITGVTAGSGLTGGGSAGGVSLSLLTSCSSGQVLQWNGTAWACSASGLGSVAHNTTLTGNGTSTTPLGITVPMSLNANSGAAIIAATNTGSGVGVQGQVGNSFPGVMGVNTGTGHGVQGSIPGTTAGTGGVYGFAGSASGMITIPAAGVRGDSKTLTGVIGTSLTGAGVMGTGAVGVLGQVTSSSPGVMGTNTGAGNGVQGSITGTITGAGGVYGISGGVSGIAQPAAGVVGDSQNQYGVLGKSSSTAGVVGISTSASGVVGQVANNFPGVQGNNTAGGSGVQGISANGTGVYGGSTNGFGMVTNTNVQQVRGGGGWVKAMAYINPTLVGNAAIIRCYNSQASGAAVSTPPCGFTFNGNDEASSILDFGFQVSDRFVSVTTSSSTDDILTTVCLIDQCPTLTPNQLFITTIGTLTNCNGTNFCDPGVVAPYFVQIF